MGLTLQHNPMDDVLTTVNFQYKRSAQGVSVFFRSRTEIIHDQRETGEHTLLEKHII